MAPGAHCEHCGTTVTSDARSAAGRRTEGPRDAAPSGGGWTSAPRARPAAIARDGRSPKAPGVHVPLQRHSPSSQPQAGGAARPGRSAGAEGPPRAAAQEPPGLPPSEVPARGCPEPRGPTHPLPSARGRRLSVGSRPQPRTEARGPRRGVRAPGPPGAPQGKGRAAGPRVRQGAGAEAGGGGAAKSTWAAAGFGRRPRGGTEGRRGAGGGRCGVPAATQLPHTPPRRRRAPTPRSGPEHAPRPEGVPTARRTRSRRGRGVPPRGAPGRAREDQPATERAHWRGRGQVRARSMRSVKAQSATWEPGACSVRARTARTRRSARSPQPAGGEKKEERNHLRVTSGKAAFCEETVASHGAPQFS